MWAVFVKFTFEPGLPRPMVRGQINGILRHTRMFRQVYFRLTVMNIYGNSSISRNEQEERTTSLFVAKTSQRSSSEARAWQGLAQSWSEGLGPVAVLVLPAENDAHLYSRWAVERLTKVVRVLMHFSSKFLQNGSVIPPCLLHRIPRSRSFAVVVSGEK